ncbi:group II intron reverse transcriptase/maturase [Streptomyces sp. F001]|uniref:group II intron reverse transcriptase/maturase n=1 Tax=Streptomyces sp. F001 TaxID=1510026 RepID=UPI00101E2BA7|nr:group II intron reverse transcriptase/maturase [Streptomyces sp. F001]RZB19516.1 group II intron reverse transcriptase/maturase [Streptomyces sp. F001]
MQIKLHRWAAADHGFRFDDVFNFVCDPAVLVMAFERVAGNKGARTAGVDGQRAADVQESGVTAHLNRIRSALKAGTFRPLPVRERMIPKAGAKLRRLGIPTVTDRVVQAALKLVLEPIFEADFRPCSYGFRPNRRAHDAIAEIHLFGSQGYRWVLDADIEACFDRIDHAALMDRVRARVKDKRVLALVKAFLKAGIMTELGERNETTSGTPQGGILSPLLANIALSALDDFAAEQWSSVMTTRRDRERRRHRGLPTWRLVRYADDFVIMVHGTKEHVEELREQVSAVLAPMGLVLSPAKTRIVHLADGFDFLGFRIVRMRKRGTDKWHVYTFIADKPVASLKRKIKTLTQRLSHLDYKIALIRINQILRGWANYFKHAVAKHTMARLHTFVWWRLVRWVMHRHRMTWTAIRRWLRGPQGRWKLIELDGITLFHLGKVPITRYRYRGNSIPSPWPDALSDPIPTA